MLSSIFNKRLSLTLSLMFGVLLLLSTSFAVAQNYHMRMAIKGEARTAASGGSEGSGGSEEPGAPETDPESDEFADYYIYNLRMYDEEGYSVSFREVPADGVSILDIQVYLSSYEGGPMNNVPVRLTTTAGTLSDSLIYSSGSMAYGTLTMPLLTHSQTITVTANIQGVAATAYTFEVSAVGAGGPDISDAEIGWLSILDDMAPANGIYVTQVQAFVKDSSGADMDGVPVVFTASAGKLSADNTGTGTSNTATAFSGGETYSGAPAKVWWTMPLQNYPSTITVSAHIENRPETLKVATLEIYKSLFPEEFSWDGSCAVNLTGYSLDMAQISMTNPEGELAVLDHNPPNWEPGQTICNTAGGDYMIINLANPHSGANIPIRFQRGQPVSFINNWG